MVDKLTTTNKWLTVNNYPSSVALHYQDGITIGTATREELKVMINQFHVALGITNIIKSAAELDFLITTMKDTSLKYWKLSQVYDALKLAISDKIDVNLKPYNEPFSLNTLKVLMKAYRAYVSPLIRKTEEANREEEPGADEETKAHWKRASIIISFNRYKASNDIMNGGDSIYKPLAHKINVSPERLEQLMSLAEENLISEFSNKASKSDRVHTPHINKIIESIISGGHNNFTSSMLEKALHDLLLKEYFDSLIKDNIDIKEVI